MNVTLKFLEEKRACKKGLEWVTQHNLIGLERKEFIKKLMDSKKYNWANWLIVRTMGYKQYVSYAAYAAEQVIDIYKKKYPDDERPRFAIESAKKCIKNPSRENKKDAADAAADAVDAVDAAHAAAHAVDAVDAAAHAAAYKAAYKAAYAAAYAAYAAHAAAHAAADAAYAAAYDARTKQKMHVKILEYGLSLLE
jgi:hypothetical protein